MLLFGENVLWLLVLIGVMIMIHELGHFWAARFFDVGVDHFLPEVHAPGPSGEAGAASDAAVARFAASARGKDLLRAYLALPDGKARAAVGRFTTFCSAR